MKRLYDLDPNEVSLVPRGANKKKFLIFKSHKGNKMAKSTEIQNLINAVDPKTMGKIDKILKGFGKDEAPPAKKKAFPMKKSNGDMAPGPNSAAHKADGADNQVTAEGEHPPLSDRAQAALKATARILAPFKDEITDGHMDAIQNEIGIDSPSDEAQPSDDDEGEGKVEMSLALPDGVEEDHHAEALDMAKKSYMSHLEKMGYRKYEDPSLEETNAAKSLDGEDDEEDEDEDEDEGGESVGKVTKVSKALDLSAFPVGQRAQLEAVFKANNDLVEANRSLVAKQANLEQQLKVERDERVLKGFEEQAKSFKHLGANTKELASVMKSLAESDPKGFEKIESVLKAADEQIRVSAKSGGGLYNEIGSRQSNTGGPSDKLEQLVDSVVAKSDGKSREQVYEEVLKTTEGKRLYAEYKASRPHGI